MCRVGDDHVGIGDHGHHPVAPDFGLLPANPLADQGVALGLLELVLDLLLVHLDGPGVLPLLVGKVQKPQHEERSCKFQREIEEHGEDVADADPGIGLRNAIEVLYLGFESEVQDGEEDGRLEDGLCRFHEGPEGEHALEALCGMEAVGLGDQGLDGDLEAHLYGKDREGAHHCDQGNGKPYGEKALQPQRKELLHPVSAHAGRGHVAHVPGEKPPVGVPGRPGEHEKHRDTRKEHHGGSQVLALGDAPLLALLPLFAGRGVLGLLLGKKLQVESPEAGNLLRNLLMVRMLFHAGCFFHPFRLFRETFRHDGFSVLPSR